MSNYVVVVVIVVVWFGDSCKSPGALVFKAALVTTVTLSNLCVTMA